MNESKAHILVIDDDERILKLLQKFLQQHNFLVSRASSVEVAVKLLEYFIYDLIILDVMLPRITGIDFAKSIKPRNTTPPIVMLTALSEPADRIKGLEAGASDYLSKPFEPQELLLRIQNLIEIHKQFKNERCRKHFGNNYYDLGSKEFIKQGTRVKLSSNEQKLLEILINKNGDVTSREDLSRQMKNINIRSVDVLMTRLRTKIEDDPREPKYLKTMRNEGYVLYS